MGNYVIAPWMTKFKISQNNWAANFEVKKDAWFHTFLKAGQKEGKTVSSTDGRLTMAKIKDFIHY